MELSPIILFVYNRPWHTGEVMNALAQNELAAGSVLYIHCDGSPDNASPEEKNKVALVRKLVKEKRGFKEVHIIESETNKGLAASVTGMVDAIINKYGQVIVLEDDILVSTQFLAFINGALMEYKNNETVFGVSGYTYPGKYLLNGTHFLPIACSWGWATWANRWQTISNDATTLRQEIILRKVQDGFNFGHYPFFNMLKDQEERKINSWAINFYASMFLQDAFFVYPQKSLVKNIGFDGEGTHTTLSDNFFDKVETGTVEINFPVPALNEDTNSIRLKFEDQFKLRSQEIPLTFINKMKKVLKKSK